MTNLCADGKPGVMDNIRHDMKESVLWMDAPKTRDYVQRRMVQNHHACMRLHVNARTNVVFPMMAHILGISLPGFLEDLLRYTVYWSFL